MLCRIILAYWLFPVSLGTLSSCTKSGHNGTISHTEAITYQRLLQKEAVVMPLPKVLDRTWD